MMIMSFKEKKQVFTPLPLRIKTGNLHYKKHVRGKKAHLLH